MILDAKGKIISAPGGTAPVYQDGKLQPLNRDQPVFEHGHDVCELENGDPEAPVDFLCQVAHLRAHTFGLPVRPHGDCEYCEGGAGYAGVMRSVTRLKTTDSAVAGPIRKFLPMTAAAAEPAGATCGHGGCASCATHH